MHSYILYDFLDVNTNPQVLNIQKCQWNSPFPVTYTCCGKCVCWAISHISEHKENITYLSTCRIYPLLVGTRCILQINHPRLIQCFPFVLFMYLGRICAWIILVSTIEDLTTWMAGNLVSGRLGWCPLPAISFKVLFTKWRVYIRYHIDSPSTCVRPPTPHPVVSLRCTGIFRAPGIWPLIGRTMWDVLVYSSVPPALRRAYTCNHWSERTVWDYLIIHLTSSDWERYTKPGMVTQSFRNNIQVLSQNLIVSRCYGNDKIIDVP